MRPGATASTPSLRTHTQCTGPLDPEARSLQVLAGEAEFNEATLRAACARLEGLEWQMQMAGTFAARLHDTLAAVLALRSATVQGGSSAVDEALALPLPGAHAWNLVGVSCGGLELCVGSGLRFTVCGGRPCGLLLCSGGQNVPAFMLHAM